MASLNSAAWLGADAGLEACTDDLLVVEAVLAVFVLVVEAVEDADGLAGACLSGETEATDF